MKKLLAGLLIYLLGAASTYLVIRELDPRGGEHPAPRPTVTVTRRNISSSVLATGIIKPMVGAEVRVGSRISGIVCRLHTNIGDHVEEGELLAELSDLELQAVLDQAMAALNMARAEVEFAQHDLQRKQELREENIVTPEQLEISQTSYRLSEFKVKEAQANVDFARTQLAYAKIRSPISGVVASVTTQEGETVAASFSTPTFVTIIDLDRLELWVYVDETDIGRVVEGQEAVFTVDTYPECEFRGEVISIYPNAVIQNTVVNYVTIVRIGDRQGKILRPEMTTNVTIFLETRENVLAVPRGAIRRDRDRYLVYVQEPDRVAEREIQVGWRDDAYTEVLSGIEKGEKILIGGP